MIKILPKSIEAEQALLGSILVDETILDQCKKYVTSSRMFYKDSNARIWNIIEKLSEENKSIDTVTVGARITQADRKKNPDFNVYYVTGLLDVGFPSKCESYAKLIAENYYQRELIRSLESITNACFDKHEEYEDIIKKVKKITDNLHSISTSKECDFDKLIKETNESIHSPVELVKYGYPRLDKLAGGMTRGEITVVAGRPGHGKTTFIINMAHKLLQQGHKVLIINREMKNVELMKKLLCLEVGMNHGLLRTGIPDIEATAKINDGLLQIKNKYSKNLKMFDDIFSLKDSTAVIEKFKPDIVIDDFIQLVRVDSRLEGRRFELEEIMTQYKMLSKRLDMVSILVSQLNRNIEQRVDPIPKMSDLAESGAIEQTAENILFVYYDFKVRQALSEYGPERNQIIAAKVRYGQTGTVTMGFDGAKCLFHDNIKQLKPPHPIKADIHIPSNVSVEDTAEELKRLVSGK